MPEIAADMESGAKHFQLESLKNNGVEIHVKAKILKIKDNGVVLEVAGGTITIPANQVVLAIGSRPNIKLAEGLNGHYSIDVLGDAITVSKALEGMTNAYEAAYRI